MLKNRNSVVILDAEKAFDIVHLINVEFIYFDTNVNFLLFITGNWCHSVPFAIIIINRIIFPSFKILCGTSQGSLAIFYYEFDMETIDLHFKYQKIFQKCKTGV